MLKDVSPNGVNSSTGFCKKFAGVRPDGGEMVGRGAVWDVVQGIERLKDRQTCCRLNYEDPHRIN